MALRNQRHAFEAADANGDGELDFSEYLTMMPSHIRNSHSEDRFRKWFAQADRDGKGTISRSEFFMWSLGTASRKFGNDGLLAVFRRYDANNSGSIDMAEFTRVVEDMGWDAKTAEEAFGEMPVRRDGTVDYLGLLAAFCDSKEGAGMSALEQLTVSMAWDAPKRSLRPDDVGVFDAPDSDTLRTQLRDVLQRNEVKGVESIFPRVEDHMDVREFQRGLQNYVFYTGPAAVLCEAFQSLDTCGAGKVGLFELNEWLGMRKLPDEEALRLEAREVLSSCAKHKALPGDVVRAFASWGNPANHKAMQLMTSRAAGLGAAGARRGTFTRKSGSCVAAALAAAATKGKPCDLTIEKQVFLKRTRRHVDNDKRWFGGLRSHFSMILGMLQRDEDDAVSVVEISMWLDGTPLHPPKGVLDGGNSQRSQLIINGEVADTVPFRANRSTPSAAKRWQRGLDSFGGERPLQSRATRLANPSSPRSDLESGYTTPRSASHQQRQQQRPASAASVSASLKPLALPSASSSLFHRRLADREPRSARRMQAANTTMPLSPRELARSLVGQAEGAVLPLRAEAAEALRVRAVGQLQQSPRPRSANTLQDGGGRATLCVMRVPDTLRGFS